MPLFAEASTVESLIFSAKVAGILAAIFVLPFVVGGFLGRRLQMPDYGWKIGVCLMALVFGGLVSYLGWPPNTGIDLSGGAIMVYQVDQAKKKPDDPPFDKDQMDKLIGAVSLRVNPGGVREITIRPYGNEQIEIIIPKVEKPESIRIRKIISETGALEFRILADRQSDDALIERALREPAKELVDLNDRAKLLGWWVPVEKSKESDFSGEGYTNIARRTIKDGDKETLEILVLKDEQDVSGDFLNRAERGTDRQGRPCVNFSFNAAGAERFGTLTGENLPQQQGRYTRKLGILLDGMLYSAPSIQSTIYDRGEITGSFSDEEVKRLVDLLNAGALPAALVREPVSDLYVGPTLGSDTIQKSAMAMLISSILVPLFMLWYYRFAGFVATLALVLNLLVTVALMVCVKAAFTLSGLAGLALTVGMAVDNNVLVYERLREERERGATLRMAIRNAFQRASAVIIDSNVTTLISAVVLYVIGSDQVRGFAVTLFLGVSMSMFTAVWVARVVFDIAERRKWIADLPMKKLIGETRIDFMRIFPVCAMISVVVIAVGLIGGAMRGTGLLDIDFTGGVSVQVLFEKEQEVGKVRNLVAAKDGKDELPDGVVTDVQVGDETPGIRFLINTSNPEMATVEKVLKTTFDEAGMKLVTNGLNKEVTKVAPRAGGPPPAEKESGQPTPKAPGTADKFAGGAEATLRFLLPVNHDTAEKLVKECIEKVEAGAKGIAVELRNPQYKRGETKAYDEWFADIALPPATAQKVVDAVDAELREQVYFPATSKIGGAVAGSTQRQAIYALIASWACMLVYLWVRFQGVAFGLAAVIALVHDVAVMFGAIALSFWLATPLQFLLVDQFKINLTIVAAFLTIIGYSVNDTIVIFDRIREVRGKMPYITGEMVNTAVNDTLSRSLITSFTVLLVCGVLYFAGGDVMRGFAFALLVGVISGSYSSIYVASPILLWLVKPKGVKV